MSDCCGHDCGTEPSAPPLFDETPAASAPPADNTAAGTAPPTIDEDPRCPVCMDDIDPGDSAMRCSGTGGRAHLFHAECLTEWLRSCQSRQQTPSCPVCRGPVQIHARRLRDFLSSDASRKLDDESRGMLDDLLHTTTERLQTMSDGFSEALTPENLANTAGIVGSAAYGFYNGWAGRSNYWETQLFYDNATRGMIIANTMGWVVGLGARLWSDAQRSEDDEGRGRGRSSRSAQAGSRRR